MWNLYSVIDEVFIASANNHKHLIILLNNNGICRMTGIKMSYLTQLIHVEI